MLHTVLIQIGCQQGGQVRRRRRRRRGKSGAEVLGEVFTMGGEGGSQGGGKVLAAA